MIRSVNSQVRPLVRRWTAGGLRRMSPIDVCWPSRLSPMVFPEGKESYSQMHQWVHRSFVALGLNLPRHPHPSSGASQCFLGAEQDDVLLDGFKVAERPSAAVVRAFNKVRSNFPKPSYRPSGWLGKKRCMPPPSVQWSDVPFDEPTLVRIQDLAQTKYASEDFLRRR